MDGWAPEGKHHRALPSPSPCPHLRDLCVFLGIRQLQLILLKVALILGIEIHVNVEFQGLVQPPEDQENERGSHWTGGVSGGALSG